MGPDAWARMGEAMAMHGIKDKVAVLGVGCAKFGDRFEASYDELALEAARDAFADAGLGPDRVDAAWLGTYLPNNGWGKASVGLADSLRFYDKPITRVENFCATGTEAFRAACMGVASGMYDIAMCVGIEKMKDRASRGIPRAGQHPLLARGATAPGLFALAATRWMHEYKQDRTPLAMVAVKNHANGAKNPKAHMQKEVTMDQVLNAPMIASPFGLFDCCPTTDGVTALSGKKPVNPSGGLKSFGHPIGASGLRMVYEVTTQLRGKGGERQVKKRDFGLAHNVGGPGAVSCVIVLGQA